MYLHFPIQMLLIDFISFDSPHKFFFSFHLKWIILHLMRAVNVFYLYSVYGNLCTKVQLAFENLLIFDYLRILKSRRLLCYSNLFLLLNCCFQNLFEIFSLSRKWKQEILETSFLDLLKKIEAINLLEYL